MLALAAGELRQIDLLIEISYVRLRYMNPARQIRLYLSAGVPAFLTQPADAQQHVVAI